MSRLLLSKPFMKGRMILTVLSEHAEQEKAVTDDEKDESDEGDDEYDDDEDDKQWSFNSK